MKLITKELEKTFEKYPIGSQDGLGGKAKVIVKYFNPIGVGTWLITEAEKQDDNDYLFFGYCHLGDDQMAELGYVTLKEMEDIRLPFGLGIERDLHLNNSCDLITAMKLSCIKPPEYLLEKYENQEENIDEISYNEE